MTITAGTLRKLSTLNLSADQMAGVLDVIASMSEAEEARKEAQRERTRRAREKQRGNVTVARQTRDGNSDDTRGGVTRVEDKTSNLEIEPQEEERKRARGALVVEFDEVFWPRYPNKVGKPAAMRSFLAARGRAELPAIMGGLERYVASKPADRPWCNPTTFLNQDRWNDQPAVVVPMARHGPAPPKRQNLADLIGKMQATHDDPRPPETPVLNLPARAIG